MALTAEQIIAADVVVGITKLMVLIEDETGHIDRRMLSEVIETMAEYRDEYEERSPLAFGLYRDIMAALSQRQRELNK